MNNLFNILYNYIKHVITQELFLLLFQWLHLNYTHFLFE